MTFAYGTIRNTTTNASGVNLTQAGANFAMGDASFTIATGTGFVVNGPASSTPTAVYLYGNVSYTNTLAAAYNTSIKNTITALPITMSTVGVASGGTGLTATPTNGQIPIGNGTGYSLATLVAGTGISITNGPGAVSIASTLAASGSTGQIQYNSGGTLAGSGNVSIDNSDLVLAESASPVVPASATLMKFIAQPVAGRELPTALNSTGPAFNLMPHQARRKYGFWVPAGGVANVPVGEGISNPNGIGTGQARTPTLTTLPLSTRRLGFQSASNNLQAAGWRFGATWFWRGNGANLGGFHYIVRWIPSTASAITGCRYFVGLNGTNTGTTNVDPSSWTNIIGVGCDSGSTTYSIMHNDGSGVATTIALGANFPANSSSTDFYELALYAPPNGSTVGYRIQNFVNGAVAAGTLSTNLPASTQGLNILGWAETATTGFTIPTEIDLVSMYIETEF